jgi:phosphoserine phosphatase
VDQACRVAGDGPLICLLGAVGADDVVELVRARSGPVTDLAVLVDTGSWAEAGATRGRRAVSATSRAELTRQRDEAADLLRAAGWQVAVASAGASVADVWRDLSSPVATGVEQLGAPA